MQGVSNFCVATLRCILETARVVPHFNQLHYHAGLEDWDGLLPFMRNHSIQMTAFGASGSGEHYHVYLDKPGVPWGEYWKTPEGKAIARVRSVAAEIGKRHNHSYFDVMMRWTHQLGIAAVTRSFDPEHMSQSLAVVSAADWELDDDEMAELSRPRVPRAKTGTFGNIAAHGGPLCRGELQ